MYNTNYKKYFFLFLIILPFYLVKAQPGKEAWHWEFGNNFSLDFSSGVPITGTCGIGALEGTASISDANTGQLLFYTNGNLVYDKNNHQMPNGYYLIGGYGTSTQAALIVPKPGSKTLYYIFTADCGGYCGPMQGVYYSVVDMTLNGGNGDVIVSTKNTLLTPPPTTEKLVGIKNCNGRDYWVITHPLNSNTFNAYLVSSTGVNPIPVVSNVGTMEVYSSSNTVAGIGYLKASPNGKKLALAHSYSTLELFDFNPSTGKVSNPMIICSTGSVLYGVTFSPDNSKLFAAKGVNGELYQYDITSGIDSVIIASATYIATPVLNTFINAMQLAPDGKIYVATGSQSSQGMAVISNPDSMGASCNFSWTYIQGSTNGLPNFIDAKGTDTIDLTDIIQCSSVSNDTLNAGMGYSSYQWSTGDTTSFISINTPGKYWLTVETQNGCLMTDTVQVLLSPSNINILKDTVFCSTMGYYLADVTYPGAQSYTWYDGSTGNTKQLNSSGTYWVDINFKGGCSVRDSFNLILKNQPIVNLGRDTACCYITPSVPIVLHAGVGQGYTYLWSNGTTADTLNVYNLGSYSVLVTAPGGCYATDSITVFAITTVYDSLAPTRTIAICYPDTFPYILTSSVPTNTTNFYYWNGNGTPDYAQYLVTDTGKYWVKVKIESTWGGSCIYTDTFHVIKGYITPLSIPDIKECNSNTAQTINAGTGYLTYQWSTGATTQTISVNNTGNYWVVVSNTEGCKASDTVRVLIDHPPVNLLHDTMICSNTPVSITLNATDTNVTSYLWSDGFTFPIHTISNPGAYWVSYTLTTQCVSRDSFNFALDSIPYVNLGKDTAICTPTYTISANSNESYLWNTGATTQNLVVTNTGHYSVVVTSPQGCKNSDSVTVTVYTSPIINLIHDSIECGNFFTPYTINASYPNTNSYLWSNGFSSAIQTINSPGLYWVSYFFSHGCVSIDSFNIAIYPYPIIDLGNDTSFCRGQIHLNAFNSSSTYLWNTGQTTSDITITSSNTYWVKVNTHGCINSDTIIILPDYSQFDFVMPNVITPNNDGINDYIDFSKYDFTSLQLDVFNRWGIKVFESNNPNCIWKPTEEDGTYFIVANYRIDCGSETKNKVLKSFITLMK